ncbi:MAG: pyridoxal phosphate-dependent aminotransferase [Eubacteriales bacterium]|nr:pyridoxal phosphate-dependent aminotransferase [Eubacteriales bacterium]MDD3199364.1 pyridoxal phosphate-dependent aminotransferase [Eubacteriales bacterium]MDD4122261.1 pyridoxal phosphate-dependent aminotransferase [Eubacteriales bacterium]MDD4629218.1 pyridoxal phosphate-dependent aminotransferase [Eubacteriales bacterium]
MVSKKMENFIANGSAIRAMFEEGKQMAAIYGAENVCDFSLGNPNLPPPETIKKAIIEILDEEDPVELHGYMNNSGYEDVREKIAKSLNDRFGTNFSHKNIVMTVGAAAGLNVIFKTLLDSGDEIMAFAPFFGEYKNYAINCDASFAVVPASIPTFQPDFISFEKMLNPKTKVVIVNTPNNPTGVVYTEETIIKLAEILNKKQKEFNTEIYLISDEPYRELVYDDIDVPYITKYYSNTIVVYSYSKSLSLAGERIGYLVIPDAVTDFDMVSAGANMATRISGFVNAPSLMQKTAAKCLNSKVDIDFYDKNRQALYDGLTKMGYECTNPDGAFYLWVKTPIEDDKKFVEMAKKYQILLVAGTFFGCPGYTRIAYCISPKTIETALPKFEALMKEIKG